MQRRLLLAVAVLLLAGCGAGPGNSDTSLHTVALAPESAPSGYSPQSIGDGGYLSTSDAAAATPAEPSQVQPFLGTGWRGAFERVWTSGSDYIDDIVFSFDSADLTARFLKMETGALSANSANYTYALPSIPGSTAFILYTQTRAQSRNVFCSGVWFAQASRAFEVLTCGGTPQGGNTALDLAVQQYQRAGGTPLTPTP